jgi:hypothetical protein
MLLDFVDSKSHFNPEVVLIAKYKAAQFRKGDCPRAMIDAAAMIWTLVVRVHALSDYGMPSVLLSSCGEIILKILDEYGARPWSKPAQSVKPQRRSPGTLPKHRERPMHATRERARN